MWVYEEIIDDKKLTDIINQEHQNIKYLPGIKLPPNIIASSDLEKVIQGSTLLIFVVPHQFVRGICKQIHGKLHPKAKAISLIKGFDWQSHGVVLISDLIRETLAIDVSVMMGANIATDVALDQFCESTLGYNDLNNAEIFKKLFHNSNFHVQIVQDVCGVEVCGALKNIIAIGAGFVDGLSLGDNTKAAVIRIGFLETIKFANLFFKGVKAETFYQSCGIADLIATCYSGRNRRVGEQMAKTGKSFEILEIELLNVKLGIAINLKGQKCQGPEAALRVYQELKLTNSESKFPLLCSIYKVCYENENAYFMIEEISK